MKQQKYALLYCRYDAGKETRNWKELLDNNRDALIEIDVEVAIAAFNDGRSDSQSIVYYGSPLAQELADFPAHREVYAKAIAAAARRSTKEKPKDDLPEGYAILTLSPQRIQGTKTGLIALLNAIATALGEGHSQEEVIDPYTANAHWLDIELCHSLDEFADAENGQPSNTPSAPT